MKKTLAMALSLVLAAALLLAGCQNADGGGLGSGDPGEEIVATLDDVYVTMDEYTFFYRIFQNNLENQAFYMGFDDDMLAFWNMDQGEILIKDQLASEALTSAKEYRLMYNAAVEKGTEADPATLAESDEMVDSLLEEVDGDEEQFFEQYKMTPDLMREMYYRMDLMEKFFEDMVEEIEVTDEEIEEAFDADRNRYSTVTVRHILISINDEMTDDESAEAQALAEDLLDQIQNGADIGALAAEYSEDPGSSGNNGEYTFGRGEMVEPFEEWSFNAQPGDQGIVETSYGFHVMEMIGHSDFESIKDTVREDIVYEKASELRNEILDPAYSDEWRHDEALLNRLNVEQELLDSGAGESADEGDGTGENAGDGGVEEPDVESAESDGDEDESAA